jgi:hypothetical protein
VPVAVGVQVSLTEEVADINVGSVAARPGGVNGRREVLEKSGPGRSARRRPYARARRCRSRALRWPAELGREEADADFRISFARQLGVLLTWPLELLVRHLVSELLIYP